MSCASMHWSWSKVEAEEAEWRWRRRSGGGGSWRWLEAGREGEGRSYHDITPLLCRYVSEQCCHGTPCLHAPDHLRSSLTLSTYTPVSLQCTLHKLAQPCHSCHQTKLRPMSNFPGLSPYVLGRRLFAFFSICCICLMHSH